MELEALSFNSKDGWSGKLPTGLDSKQTLIMAFGSSDLTSVISAINSLTSSFPNSVIVGCSTAGEILGDGISDDGLVVAIVRFHATLIKVATAASTQADQSYVAGRDIATELFSEDLRGVLVLSEGLSVNGSTLVDGLNSVLPKEVVITGGLAADGDRFEQTWVLATGEASSGKIAAVGFYGDSIKIHHSYKGGWDIFGVERHVTRAEGNVLYELDGKPALELYKEYLGERASGLPATGLLFPLLIREESGSKEAFVRTLLAVDEKEQSITYAGEIKTGDTAQLMRANFDRLIDGASDAAALIDLRADEHPSLAIAISCVGRRLVLGERAEEEVEVTLDALESVTKMIGFYSYGELSPHGGGVCELHNQTMTLTVLSEI